MIGLNVKFQEKYKQLDAICKDIFLSKDGVTQYIIEMEKNDWQIRRFVQDWDYIYKNLKHFRWLRNQLAHEVGAFESDLCTIKDLVLLDDFINSVLKSTDPLAMAKKAYKAECEHKKKQNCKVVSDNSNTEKDTITGNEKGKHKTSLWGKIKSIFKKLIS